MADEEFNKKFIKSLDSFPSMNRADGSPKELPEFFEILEAFKNLDFKRSVSKSLAYSSFDARRLRLKVENIAERNPNVIAWLILLFLKRGNNIDRIIDTTGSNTLKLKIRTLKTIYDIKRVGKRNPTAVTLSRIAVCFPEITALCNVNIPADFGPILSLNEIRRVADYDEYPAVAKHFAVCSLFIRENTIDFTKAMDVVLLPNMMLSERIINFKKETWQRCTPQIQENKKKQRYAANSNIFEEKDRLLFAEQLGVYTSNKSLSSVWNAAAAKAKVALEKMYGNSFQSELKT